MTYFIEGIFDNSKVEASVTMRPFRESDRHLNGFVWYGTDDGLPELVIAKISLTIGGQSIEIPAHVYGRHGDFAFQGAPLSLSSRKNHLILRYGGSDGAGAYFLEIVAAKTGFLSAKTFTHNPVSGDWE